MKSTHAESTDTKFDDVCVATYDPEIEGHCSEVQKTVGEEIGMEMQARAAQHRSRLASQEVAANGLHLSNCHFVKFGFVGNLEVISRTAMETLLKTRRSAKQSSTGCGKGKSMVRTCTHRSAWPSIVLTMWKTSQLMMTKSM